MWLNILLVLFAWFVAAVPLGILIGKSMALGNRHGCCPYVPPDEPDQDSAGIAADLARLHEVQSIRPEPVFHD